MIGVKSKSGRATWYDHGVQIEAVWYMLHRKVLYIDTSPAGRAKRWLKLTALGAAYALWRRCFKR